MSARPWYACSGDPCTCRKPNRNELAEFVLARIAADEMVASAVLEADPKCGNDVFTSLSEPTGTVEMSPNRMLAECESKRLVVEHVRFFGGEAMADTVLRYLSVPYAGHPDHRSEWLP